MRALTEEGRAARLVEIKSVFIRVLAIADEDLGLVEQRFMVLNTGGVEGHLITGDKEHEVRAIIEDVDIATQNARAGLRPEGRQLPALSGRSRMMGSRRWTSRRSLK